MGCTWGFPCRPECALRGWRAVPASGQWRQSRTTYAGCPLLLENTSTYRFELHTGISPDAFCQPHTHHSRTRDDRCRIHSATDADVSPTPTFQREREPHPGATETEAPQPVQAAQEELHRT